MQPTALLTKTVIRHPRFTQLQQHIVDCMELTTEIGEPQCLCLIGATGVGKSTLVKSFASTYPRQEQEFSTRVPILYLETPHPITVKGMTSALLDVLGDPRAFKGTQAEMNARLQGFIRDCGVRLVILDDFHHLVDRNTNRVLREVSEWLKVLIKNTGIVYLVVGIDGEVERVLQNNPQLSRLFVREYLSPFVWDAARPETIQAFAQLLVYIQTALKIQLTDELSQAELLLRIHHATGGVISSMMYLFHKAKQLQNQRTPGQLMITLPTLAHAYDLRLRSHTNRANPFYVAAQAEVAA